MRIVFNKDKKNINAIPHYSYLIFNNQKQSGGIQAVEYCVEAASLSTYV